jgi:hypothetical protein
MLAGVFPFVDPDTPTVVNFYSVKTLYDNIPIAVDWSKYLLKTTSLMSEGEDIEFNIDGYARKNTLNYAIDDANLLDTSGVLMVINSNIDPTNELFTLNFAAGRRASINNFVVDYPLYDIKIESGQVVKTLKDQPLNILGKVVDIDGINTLQFTDDLLLSYIDSTENYSYYQQIIEQPRIIRERFFLDRTALIGIDVKIPIYLSQYGQYYAILEAQIADTYEADVTLLEIK